MASELFRLFESYVKYDNKDVLDYVIMVIEIFQNCSEVSNLSDNILSIDVVSQLTAVANKVLNDKFGNDTPKRRD